MLTSDWRRETKTFRGLTMLTSGRRELMDRQLGALGSRSNPVWQECRTRCHHRLGRDNLVVSTHSVHTGRPLERRIDWQHLGARPPKRRRHTSQQRHQPLITAPSSAPSRDYFISGRPRHHSAFDPGSVHRKLRRTTLDRDCHYE